MQKDILTKLRNKQPVNLFSHDTKLFTRIQFNKKESSFVCWERWVSLDRRSWVNHNLYLSLKDVNQIINLHKK